MVTRSAMACRGTQTPPLLSEVSPDARRILTLSHVIGGTTPKVWDALPAPGVTCSIQLAAPTGMELPRSWSSGSSASSLQPAILIAKTFICFHLAIQFLFIEPPTSEHKTPWAQDKAGQEQPPCVPFPYRRCFLASLLLLRLVLEVSTYCDALYRAVIALCACGRSEPQMAANARNRPAKVSPSRRHPAPP